MSDPKTILLVDASNLIFRMYFALERTGMTAPDGRPSWAIFGFFKALLDILEKNQPTAIIAAFDAKGTTFRHQAVQSYKANRPTEMPPELAAQWPEIKRGMEYLGMHTAETLGYEADDLIGSLSAKAQLADWQVLIFSGDKDNFQLVNPNVKVLYPSTKGMQDIDYEGVKLKMGVYPEQVVDYKALRGDPSDNIPGVAGIGEKGAIKLLEEFGSLENIYQNLAQIKSVSLRQKLIEGEESADQSKFLATIKQDCPTDYDFRQVCHKLKPQIPELASFLKEYKLHSLAKRLPQIFESFGNTNFKEAQLDLGLTKETTEFKNELNIQYQTIFTESELKNFLQKAQSSEFFALDLETDGLNTFECEIVGFALAHKNHENYQACYIPVFHNYLGAPNQLKLELVIQEIKNFLENWNGYFLVQNLKFESKILQRYQLELPANSLDTMLASYLENPDNSAGLKNQAWRILNFKMQNIEALLGPKGKNQKTMNQIEIEQVTKYAADDAALTLALGKYYLQSLNSKQKELWQNIESPLAFLIAEMETRGVYLNANKLAATSTELATKITQIESQIHQGLGTKQINLNSAQQLSKALANAGFTLKKATSSGQLSTDHKTLQTLANQDQTGLIANIIEYRMLNKLKSTYTDSLLKQINGQTGRVHGEFNQALTSTGRLSSSNPNLQNIPIKNQTYGQLIRGAFEGQDQKLLISADYSQIELRLLAHYTQDPILLEAFNNHQDIHARTASEIFEIPLEQVNTEQRRLGKTLNFALVYQQGAYATAEQLGISNKEAAAFIEKYFATFLKVRPFVEEVLEGARLNGYVETLWGRRRYFKNLHSSSVILRKAEERAAFNTPLQGTAADIMKIAMLKVKKQIQTQKLDAKIILQVHDEIVLEVCPEQNTEIKQILLNEMTKFDQAFKVPIEVQIAIGNNWANCK